MRAAFSALTPLARPLRSSVLEAAAHPRSALRREPDMPRSFSSASILAYAFHPAAPLSK